VVIALGTIFALRVALPGYDGRTFTLTERLLTEGRVLFFYISLIVAPRLNDLGLLHDDIPISTSLWTPWTTLPALAGLLTLTVLAIALRRRLPMVCLGVLWFLAGHLLESTIFPLEIAHEHRNYLASLGILLACAGIMESASTRLATPWPRWLLPLLVLAFASITYVRSTHWSNATNLFYYEAVHHPNSPGATAGLANLLLAQGRYDDSVQAMRTASRQAPTEPAFLISLQTVAAKRNQPIDPADSQEILTRLAAQPITAVTKWALSNASECLLDECKTLQKPMETWMRLLLDRLPNNKADGSYYYYFLGRAYLGQGLVNEAIDAYRRSYDLDPYYYQPLFDLATVYVGIGRPDLAKVIFSQIELANIRNPHKRDTDILRLKEHIDSASRKYVKNPN
jgi:tetratricopeptide (TPR) repeat protein